MPSGIENLFIGIRTQVNKTTKAVKELRQTSAATAAKVAGDVERIKGSAERLKSDVKNLFEELSQGTVVDDVLLQLDKGLSIWDESIADFIRGFKDGALSIGEVLSQFGDVRIQLEDGSKTLNELFEGLDPRRFRDRAQKLRLALREETLGLREISDLLGQMQIQTAKDLQDLIKLVQENRISLDEALRRIDSARRRLGGDSATGALAENLAEVLRRAQRDGTI